MRLLSLPFLLMIAAGCSVGEAQRPRVPRELQCRVDADCVVVRQPPSCGPCGGCTGAPQGMARRYVDAEARACVAQRRREAAHERAAELGREPRRVPPNCSPCPAPPESASWNWVPVCRSNACGAVVSDEPE